MVLEDILRLVEQDGYQKVGSNLPELCLYHKMDQDKSLYVLITDTRMNGSQNPQAVRGLMLQVVYKLRLREQDCGLLSVIISDQIAEYRELANMENTVWLIDRTQPRLFVYENQEKWFDSLRNKIEKLFDQYFTVNQRTDYGAEYASDEKNQNTEKVRSAKKWPVICGILAVVNILIYLFTYYVMGAKEYNEIMRQFGIRGEQIVAGHEYYRLFTYMFLHFGMDHLLNNMLVLFFVGKSLEVSIARWKFIFIYFGSGIIAGAVSMGYNMIQNHNVLSAGASGAIFGLVGAMLYVVLINRGRLCNIGTRQILLFIVFSLYGGFASGNVDNAAHIGGFLAGIILAAILVRREGAKKGKISEG